MPKAQAQIHLVLRNNNKVVAAALSVTHFVTLVVTAIGVSAPLRDLYASEPVNKDQELLRKSPKARRLLIRRWNATTRLIGSM